MEITITLSKESVKEIALEVQKLNSQQIEVKNPIIVTEKKLTKAFYSVPDISKMTGLNTITIRYHIKTGLLKGSKTGQRWLISQENFNNYLNIN